jgi:hypothetical protein
VIIQEPLPESLTAKTETPAPPPGRCVGSLVSGLMRYLMRWIPATPIRRAFVSWNCGESPGDKVKKAELLREALIAVTHLV